MASLEAALRNEEEATNEIITIVGPEDWGMTESMLPNLLAAFQLGEKELRMYVAFLLILLDRKNGDQPSGFPVEGLKRLLGKGFKRDCDFRMVRKRLERANLLEVKRDSLPEGRGGVRLTYRLVLLPTIRFSGDPLVLKTLYKSYIENINIKDKVNLNLKIQGGESVTTTKTILNGVDDWDAPLPRAAAEKPVRGDTSADVKTWGGRHRVNYFQERYYDLHGSKYLLPAGRGVHERRSMDLPVSSEVYKDFIDWAFAKKELKSINFLPDLLNTYLRDNIVAPEKRLEEGVKGEFLKVPYRDGQISVVHQYGGFAVVDKQILALDAYDQKLITIDQIVAWDLCPRNVLNRMGLVQ